MRFSVAWANVVSENVLLKMMVALLMAVSIGLAVAVAALAGRKPLIVERACYSRALSAVSESRTPSEVEAFVREVVPLRFDTDALVKPGVFSAEEERFREQEQQELKKRNITQRVLVNSVSVDGSTVTVNADRVLGVGAVRSALAFPLTVQIGSAMRSEGNPYGLTAIRVSAPKEDQKKGGNKK